MHKSSSWPNRKIHENTFQKNIERSEILLISSLHKNSLLPLGAPIKRRPERRQTTSAQGADRGEMCSVETIYLRRSVWTTQCGVTWNRPRDLDVASLAIKPPTWVRCDIRRNITTGCLTQRPICSRLARLCHSQRHGHRCRVS